MEYRSRSRFWRVRARRTWLAASGVAVVLVAIVAVAVVGSGGGTDRDQPTAWQALLARHTEEGLSRQLALDAFATLIGPVPGGNRASAGSVGTRSATPAVRWMLAVWDELEPAQRDAFQQAVYGQEPGSATGATGGAGAAGRGVAALPILGQPADRDPALERELGPEVEAVAEDFTARAGIAMPRTRVVVSTVTHPDDDDTDDETHATADYRTSAAPGSPRGEDRSSTCVITFYPPATDARDGSPQDQQGFVLTVAHELYHCHQFLVQEDAYADLADWVVEGSAEWAGHWYAAQVLAGYLSTEGTWQDYFAWPVADPPKSLYRLSYDAIGLFAHLDHTMLGSVGEDTWSTIDAMLLADGNDAAFTLAARAGGAVFLRQWAMGMFQNPDLGSEWIAAGPGLPEIGPTAVVDHRLAAANSVLVEVEAAPGVARARVAVAEQTKLLRADITGHGAFHWAGPELEERGRTEWYDAPQGEVRWYCFTGQCGCPDGATPPGVHDMPPPSTISVALTGGTGLATVTLTAATVEELCDPGKDSDRPVEPVRDCVDVLRVVRQRAPHYDTQREVSSTDLAFQCSITYTKSPVLDDSGNYLELGVLDEIMVTVATGGDDRPEACPPDGYCVETRTQHVAEVPGIPAYDVVHTTVNTRRMLLAASEETHGPQTPTDQIVQIALDIQAGTPG